ncbi:zinc ribbon domain-containing protein [Streptomyces mesophilus]
MAGHTPEVRCVGKGMGAGQPGRIRRETRLSSLCSQIRSCGNRALPIKADTHLAPPHPQTRWRASHHELPLNVRTWTCACGTTHDRDVNAAKNLLAAGRAVSACGAGVRPQRSSPGGQSAMKQEVSRREP